MLTSLDYEKYPPTSPLYQRGKVVEEIVTTEGEYLKYLEAIIKVWLSILLLIVFSILRNR